MNAQEIGNLTRQIATWVFAFLTAHGITTAGQSHTLVTDATVIVPAALSAASVLWSVYAHWNMKKVPETAVVE